MRRPGRLAMLTRAAYDPTVTPAERATLIRYGAPDHDPEHVLKTMRGCYDLRKQGRGDDAATLLAQLTQPPEGPA